MRLADNRLTAREILDRIRAGEFPAHIAYSQGHRRPWIAYRMRKAGLWAEYQQARWEGTKRRIRGLSFAKYTHTRRTHAERMALLFAVRSYPAEFPELHWMIRAGLPRIKGPWIVIRMPLEFD